MNYRHAFHAGNFADAMKHVALVELLRLLTAKDKPLFVLDTHAGRGGYDLTAADATRTGEADRGVARLMRERSPPAPVSAWLAGVQAYARKFGGGPMALRGYPGSPRLIRAWLRPGDRLVACEKHPEELRLLRREFSGDTMVETREGDGYAELKALLPPPERRGLVLIDPPFEAPDEAEKALRALRHGVRRFATGTYAFWHPIKDDALAAAWQAEAAALTPGRALALELRLDATPSPSPLNACGLLVLNPPWRFDEAMEQALPWIAERLGVPSRARGVVRAL